MTNKAKLLLSVLLMTLVGVLSGRQNLAYGQDKLQDFDYWANLCNSLLKSQKFKDAVTACDQAITQNPTEPVAWLDRGDALAGMGMTTEAVVSYDRFLKLQPLSSEALTKRCRALNELARYEEAITACAQALKLDQNWQDISPALAWYLQGAILQRWNRLAEALESYGLAIRTNPNYSLALSDRCAVLAKLDRLGDAIPDCDRAIRVNANWGSGSLADAWAHRARIDRQLQRFDGALTAYDKALALRPSDARSWTEQGSLLWELGRFTEALASHEWALKTNDKYSLALANKCAALNQLGQYKDALTACDSALQTGDQQWNELGPALAWDQRGSALTGLGKLEEALASANRAIALRSDYAEFWSNRGATLWSLGRFNEALSSTNQAIALNPNSSGGWFNHGRILVSLNRTDEALQAYDKALAGDANIGNKLSLADIWVNKSALLWRLRRYNEALASAIQATVINPQSAGGWFNRGLSQTALDRLREALQSYNRAINIDPKNADYWTARGQALLSLNENPEALSAFEQALKLNPSQAQALVGKSIVAERLKPRPPAPPARTRP